MSRKKIIPFPILIGAIVGFLLFFGLGFNPGTGETSVTAGIIVGIIGAVIGGAIGLPIHLIRRGNPNQAIVESHNGIAIDDPDSVTGLWRLRKGLVIDSNEAVYPAKCIFTNQPITELLPFTVGCVEKTGAGPVKFVRKKTRIEFLPVSKEWLRTRKAKGLKLRIAILVASAVLLSTGILLSKFNLVTETQLISIISITIVGFIVGAVLPKLSGFNDRQEIYSAYFFKDGRILIPKPAKEFIADFPELKEGFLHGFLGIEQLLSTMED